MVHSPNIFLLMFDICENSHARCDISRLSSIYATGSEAHTEVFVNDNPNVNNKKLISNNVEGFRFMIFMCKTKFLVDEHFTNLF